MEKYDVVIIGAGIGGLTCGCYLAKAGLKVLIVEQHDKPGGYCTSFERQGYRFDVGVHYLGSLKSGTLRKILDELEIDLETIQIDPTDKIIMPDNATYIRADYFETINEFKKSFPEERNNIERFFKFIMQKDLLNIYRKVNGLTFQDVLDNFFENHKIKSTLEVLLANIGLPARNFSALSAIILYRDYILDGGYYPRGGMQGFSDLLASKLKECKGDLVLKQRVEKIILSRNKVDKVIFSDGTIIKADIVVSNIDATQTFKRLLGGHKCREAILVDRLIVSPSIFALYIGIDEDLRNITNETCNIWSLNSYAIGDYLSNLRKNILRSVSPFIMMSFPSAHSPELINKNKNTIQFFLIAPFESRAFWDRNRNIVEERLLRRAEKVLPNLKKYIKVKVSATPYTFYRYTLNKDGAAFGWASIVNQTRPLLFPQKTSVNGLYLVGHWCTIGSGQGGVPKVAFAGRRAAELILRVSSIHKK